MLTRPAADGDQVNHATVLAEQLLALIATLNQIVLAVAQLVANLSGQT